MEKIGKYEVLERIGVGGFGEVFKGRDPFIKRIVAIKTCSADDEDLRQRFLKEGEIAGRLQHPNVTLVYDFGYHDETPFLVQEYLSGEDLGVKIKRRNPLTLETKVDYLIQVAEGLEYAHSMGVIHRDIKPSNIRVLEDGVAKIMDFGIGKLVYEETRLTQEGTTFGTPSYLAPEQLRGGEPDAKIDVFSFGSLAYELLSYRRPFEAADIAGTFYKILNEDPERLDRLVSGCPPELADVVHRCLAKEHRRRYAGFSDLLTDLRPIRALICKDTASHQQSRPSTEVPSREADLPLRAARSSQAIAADAGDIENVVEWREQTTRSEPVVEKGDFPITTPSVPLESPLVTPSEAFETVGRRRVARSVLGAVVLLLLVFVAGWWLLREGGPASGPIAEGPPVPVPVYEAVLQIDSEPRGAGVWIDGEELAGLVTPTAMEVGGRMGRKVQLELRQDGKAVAETELVLGPGMPLRWAPTLSLPTETFRIMSRPAGGRVVLDGEPLEQPTPVEVDLDPRGRYQVQVELSGHMPAGLTFTLDELGEEQRASGELVFQLRPAVPAGYLVVDATYPVEIGVEGQRHRLGARGEIALRPGSHDVTLQAPEVFYSARNKVEITSGEKSVLVLPPAIEITIGATPSHCRVTIGGRDAGFVPIQLRLVVGSHQMEFDWVNLGKRLSVTEEIRIDTRQVFRAADQDG
jgi:serine/threonine protein kinase